jgi:hypothetical protein
MQTAQYQCAGHRTIHLRDHGASSGIKLHRSLFRSLIQSPAVREWTESCGRAPSSLPSRRFPMATTRQTLKAPATGWPNSTPTSPATPRRAPVPRFAPRCANSRAALPTTTTSAACLNPRSWPRSLPQWRALAGKVFVAIHADLSVRKPANQNVANVQALLASAPITKVSEPAGGRLCSTSSHRLLPAGKA